jgi:membrane-bound lytic murein transglycosylase F
MRYIAKIFAAWSMIPDKEQRIKFTLGSYNAGKCHIEDAQKLAIAHGLNPNVWDGNVALMVLKLADPDFYRAPDVRCGAYRGHAVSYVETVYNRYLAWK